MALDFKTPTEVGAEYLENLKSLRPDVDISQTDNDWFIRSRVTGGVVSGVYADQQLIADDAFPQSARREALEKHLNLWFGSGFIQPTPSQGLVTITGTPGSSIAVNQEFVYEPNGNAYQSTEAATIPAGGSIEVNVQSVANGQAQNLLSGAQLTVSGPPAGIDNTAIVGTDGLSDGRNEESNEQAAERITERVQTPSAGGNETDYAQFARDADDSVVSAQVVPFVEGLGTVGVVITAGTTDIDEAIDNDLPIIITPSAILLQNVKNFIDALNPVTDCVFIFGPTEVVQDVTVRVTFVEGDLTTVPSGTTLTQQELVQREVKRVIFKNGVGGRKLKATDRLGFLVAADIEEGLDERLGSVPSTIGSDFQILSDRQVDNLDGLNVNRQLQPEEFAIPGTITVVDNG